MYLLTSHDLPLEVLPKQILARIQNASNVHVESEMISFLASLQASDQPLSGFTHEEECAIEKHIGPYLALFHPGLKATALKLKDLYSVSLILDCLPGMDSEVMVLSLSLGKPVWMLDAPFDFYETSITLHKLMLEDEIKTLEGLKSSVPSDENNNEYEEAVKKLSLFTSDRDAFLRESIKENIAEIGNSDEIQATLRSTLEDYSKFNVNDVSVIERDEDSVYCKVEERNNR